MPSHAMPMQPGEHGRNRRWRSCVSTSRSGGPWRVVLTRPRSRPTWHCSTGNNTNLGCRRNCNTYSPVTGTCRLWQTTVSSTCQKWMAPAPSVAARAGAGAESYLHPRCDRPYQYQKRTQLHRDRCQHWFWPAPSQVCSVCGLATEKLLVEIGCAEPEGSPLDWRFSEAKVLSGLCETLVGSLQHQEGKDFAFIRTARTTFSRLWRWPKSFSAGQQYNVYLGYQAH